MKKLLYLAPLLLALVACHSISLPTPNGTATVKSLGQRVRIKSLSYSTNGTLKVEGYNNDQATALIEGFKAGIDAAKMSQGVPVTK